MRLMMPTSLAMILAAAIAAAGSLVHGQDAARWQVTAAVIPVDFTDKDATPRKTLAKTGLVCELPIALAMLRESVTLAVNVPEAGDVRFLMSTTDALVDITTKRVNAGEVHILLRSQLGRMGVQSLQTEVRDKINTVLAVPREQAAAEAKQKKPAELRKYLGTRGNGLEDNALAKPYIERRGIELGKGLLNTALEELVAERPRWVTRTEQASWPKASAEQLHQEYERLLGLFLADEHLKRCGIRLDTNTRNFDALIRSKFTSLHALVTGGTLAADAESSSVRSLSREEIAGLRRALVVEGTCQFVPATDPGDANSQWFNAQRIGVSAAGVPEIRVVGSLNPAQGDRSDWWRLVGYDPDQVQLSFSEGTGFRHELHQDADQGTCLRIVATNQQSVTYTFTLRKRSSPIAGDAVVVHESPGESNAKFPY